MRLIFTFELRRSGVCSLERQKTGVQFKEITAKQMFGKQMFAGPFLNMRHRENIDQTGLARFFPITY